MKIGGVNVGGTSKRTTNLQDQQANIGNQQQQAFQDVLPQYMKGLDFLSNYAGLGNFHPQGFGSTANSLGNGPAGPAQPTQLGGYYNPPPSQGGWNWNPTYQTPASAAPAAPPPGSAQFAYMNTPGLNPNMQGTATGRQAPYLPPPIANGQGDPMGPSPYSMQPAFDYIPQGQGDARRQQMPFDPMPPGPGTRGQRGKGDPELMMGEGDPYRNLTGVPMRRGMGDPIPSLPAMPGSPSQPLQAQAAAAPPMPGQARPQSNMQQYMQSTPGMGQFNAHAGSLGNHQTEQTFNTANPGAAAGAAGGGMGPSPYTNNAAAPTGGVSNSQMGIFNDPADALRNSQAQDDINHQNYLNQQNLKSQMGSRGLEDSSILGGGLSQMNQNALQNYAGFRRNLAINAGQEQQNRVLQFMAAMNPGMAMGGQAQSNYGQLSGNLVQQQQAQQQALAGYGQMLGQIYYGGY